MEEIRIFTHPIFGDIRVTGTYEYPNFCATDVCRALGYKNGRDAIIKHCDIGDVTKYDTPTASGTQTMTYVNESGLYSLILRSKLEGAKKFKKWVTGDVLPSIRKTGGYIATSEQDSPELIMARALQIAKATIDKHKQMLEQAHERITLQEQVIKEAAPKVLFANSILASKTSCLIGELAKILTQNGCHIGQNKLFKWLRGNGYLCTRGEQYNLPLQKYVDMGLFEIKKSTHSENEVLITTSTTKVTPKGQQYFINKFLNY